MELALHTTELFFAFQVIEKFIRFAYRKRYDGQNMTYKASTFLYAIAVSIFALGGMCGGFFGGWIANKFGRYGRNQSDVAAVPEAGPLSGRGDCS